MSRKKDAVRSRTIPGGVLHEAGLEFFDSLDCADPYEFDTLKVIKDTETGLLIWGHDSGCSCPIPFDEFRNTDDYRLVNLKDPDWLLAMAHQRERGNSDEADSFELKIKQYLKGLKK